MEFKQVIESRYSCRKYLDQSIELTLLKSCLATARLAPSACNSQPWRFHLINDQDLKQQFVKLTQPFTKNASFIVIEEDKPNFQQRIVNRLKDQEFNQVDIGIACSYICLQASDLGLSTCMIGYFNEAKIKKILDIKNNNRIRVIIAIGYGDKREKKKLKRKNLNEIMKIY